MWKLMPRNLINLIHGQLAQGKLPLLMPFPHSDLHFYHPVTCIPLNHICPFITNYPFGSIHFSTILKENLYHLLMPMECWYVQRSVAFLRNPTWSANADTQKRMVSKQMLNNIHLLPCYFTFKKMQTQHWLCQSITNLPACCRKHALSIGTTHWCANVPKDANCMACLGKAMLCTTFFAFKEIQVQCILKHSNKASYSTLWTHQKTSTQMPHPWCKQSPLEKCLKHKPFLWGAHILTWWQEKHFKLCASLLTVYSICTDVHTDAVKPHQTYPWTIGSMQSAIANVIPTIWPSFLPPWHAFVWITSVYSLQITSQAEFTSAPFWRRISTTSLHPSCADTYKGVAPSWGIQHGQQMQTHKRWWLANKWLTISIYCPFSHSRTCKHSIDCVKE